MEEVSKHSSFFQAGNVTVILIMIVVVFVLGAGILHLARRTGADSQQIESSQENVSPPVQTLLPEIATSEPALEAVTASADTKYLGRYQTEIISDQGLRQNITLEINRDNSVVMTEEQENNETVIKRTGFWSVGSDGLLVVAFTQEDGIEQIRPQIIIFRKDGVQLQAATYEEDFWGREGFVLQEV